MGSWQESGCNISVAIARDTQALVEEMLSPEFIERNCQCKVIKHPDCCVLCRGNNDCAKIPMHVRCFPAGTVVSGPRVVASVTRWYSGELVEFETRLGSVLAATPNHPVLTPQGWVGAGLLDEGGQVVRQIRPQRFVVGDPGDDQQPALIEDVARSVGESGSVVTARVPMSTEALHGDGVGSKVAVVRTNGLLRDHVQAAHVQQGGEAQFGAGDVGESALSGLSAPALLLERDWLSTDSGMGSNGPGGMLLGSPAGHHEPVGITASPVVREVADVAGDGVAADAVVLRERLDGLAGAVALDQIVKVRRFPFSGHVYNLETRLGWYLADSIIVHNCRCRQQFEC